MKLELGKGLAAKRRKGGEGEEEVEDEGESGLSLWGVLSYQMVDVYR